MKRKEKGITLIALVLTIIVMLILVAVSIRLAVNGGLFSKAGEAVKNTEEERDKELAMSGGAINIDGQEYTSIDEYITKLGKPQFPSGILTENTEYTDSENETAIVPKGFKVQNLDAKPKISDGLVIADEDGNEFVWIPVGGSFGRKDWGKGITLDGSAEPYTTTSYNSEKVEYTAMKKSVEDYGGFYIGRYEAGRDNGNLVVQRDMEVYNSIMWGETMSLVSRGAVALCRGLYPNDTTNKSGVISTLCYGIQWDSALKFIEDPDSTYPTVVSGNGNYSGILAKTGLSDDYKFKNIYDMAGNVAEWTMESTSDWSRRIHRGGSCSDINQERPASFRADAYPNGGFGGLGFRLALYIR